MSAPDPESLLRITLRQGTVYYFQHRELSSELPHYFIVMNAHAAADEILLMVVVTSNLAGVRQRCAGLPGTWVEITPKEYSELTMLSAVDCNQVIRISRIQIIEKIRCREIGYKDDLPDAIMEKLINAVLSSPKIEETIKTNIRR